jgi:hypothetical protein
MSKKQTKGAPEAQGTTQDNWTEVKPEAPVATATEATPAPKKPRKPKAAEPVEEAVTIEPTPAPAKKRKATSAPQAETAVEPPAPVEAAPAPKKPKRAKSGATLQDVFKGYVESLEADGKSDGTIASYRMELELAGADLGLDTPIASIKPERVLLFMTSDRVMKKRSGKPKSPLSIDKTRRVLRQALVYAETAKLVAKAPVPELAASH